MSSEERTAQRAKVANAVKLSRQRKNASMTPEERTSQRAKKAAAASKTVAARSQIFASWHRCYAQ